MSTETQKLRILSYLKSGQSITSRKAKDKFGCERLAARVHELRENGHPIQKTMVEVPTRDGTTRVAQYWME